MAAHSFVLHLCVDTAGAPFCRTFLHSSVVNILAAGGRMDGFRTHDSMDAPVAIDDCAYGFHLFLIRYFHAAEIRTCV